MITIETLMTFSEMRELSKTPYKKFTEIEVILKKDFKDVTIGDLNLLASTSIFDHNFTDLLFSELIKRYENHLTL